MKFSNTLPCLIIGYGRRQGINSNIRKAIASGSKRVYISLDGPADSLVSQQQMLLQDDISSIRDEFPEVQISLRKNPSNFGVALGVISGIEWFFSIEEKGVIVEDDLLVDKDFFKFCTLALDRYEFDDRVWMICGSQFLSSENGSSKEISWSQIPQIWGWASTRIKWQSIRHSVWNNNKNLRLFGPPFTNYWNIGYRRAIRGEIDTWDIPIVACALNLNKYVITPPVNLVTNVGFDEFSSHTQQNVYPLGISRASLPSEIVWSVNPNDEKVKNYHKKLSKTVYKVKYRHLLLPIRYEIETLIRYFLGRKSKELIPRWKKIVSS